MSGKKAQKKKRGNSPTVREGSMASRRGATTQSVRSPRVSKSNLPVHESPQQFSPTLGELDLHLFGEGKHERIYEKLGAHVVTHEGKRGVAFAVWAPNAKSVSVVGNFNDWNGSSHQMRRLGS